MPCNQGEWPSEDKRDVFVVDEVATAAIRLCNTDQRRQTFEQSIPGSSKRRPVSSFMGWPGLYQKSSQRKSSWPRIVCNGQNESDCGVGIVLKMPACWLGHRGLSRILHTCNHYSVSLASPNNKRLVDCVSEVYRAYALVQWEHNISSAR